MRTIAHLSDLHFGAHDPEVVEGLAHALVDERPSVVVASGDLTQRARTHEFAAAMEFLDRLPRPLIAVPGNHDIPLLNLRRRLISPLERYRRFISSDRLPFYRDDELAVLGLNTARSNVWKGGRVSHAQMAAIRGRFADLPDEMFKVLVTHHPFVPPPSDPRASIVGRSGLALEAGVLAGIDVLLAGHRHERHSVDAGMHHSGLERAPLVVLAGTASSHRRRGEANSFNWLVADGERMTVEVREWDGGEFVRARVERWHRRDGAWEQSG